MQALVHATYQGPIERGIAFALDDGWQCRVFVLDAHLMRILLVPPDGLREPRTWAVAPGDVDVPWEGRDRQDNEGFPEAAYRVAEAPDAITVSTSAITLRVRLRPFGLTWQDPAGRTFAQDRPTYAYQWSERSGVVRHYVERTSSDQYFGLGDKTGPLDKHGRRFRSV